MGKWIFWSVVLFREESALRLIFLVNLVFLDALLSRFLGVETDCGFIVIWVGEKKKASLLGEACLWVICSVLYYWRYKIAAEVRGTLIVSVKLPKPSGLIFAS